MVTGLFTTRNARNFAWTDALFILVHVSAVSVLLLIFFFFFLILVSSPVPPLISGTNALLVLFDHFHSTNSKDTKDLMRSPRLMDASNALNTSRQESKHSQVERGSENFNHMAADVHEVSVWYCLEYLNGEEHIKQLRSSHSHLGRSRRDGVQARLTGSRR